MKRNDMIDVLVKDYGMVKLSRKSKEEIEEIYNKIVLNNDIQLEQESLKIKLEENNMVNLNEEVVLEEEIIKVENVEDIQKSIENMEIIGQYDLLGKNKTQKMIILFENGYSISKIKDILEIRYQHVYNTLKRKGLIVSKVVDDVENDDEVVELEI